MLRASAHKKSKGPLAGPQPISAIENRGLTRMALN